MSDNTIAEFKPVPPEARFNVPIDVDNAIDFLTAVSGDAILATATVDKGAGDFVFPLLDIVASRRTDQLGSIPKNIYKDSRIVALEIQGYGGTNHLLNALGLGQNLTGTRRTSLDRSRQQVIEKIAELPGFDEEGIRQRLSAYVDEKPVFSPEELIINSRFARLRQEIQAKPADLSQYRSFRKSLATIMSSVESSASSDQIDGLAQELFEVKPAEDSSSELEIARASLQTVVSDIASNTNNAFAHRITITEKTFEPVKAMLDYAKGTEATTTTAFAWMLESVPHADAYVLREQLIFLSRKIILAS